MLGRLLRGLGCNALGCFGSAAMSLVLVGVGWFGFVAPAISAVTGQVEYVATGGERGQAPLVVRPDAPEDLTAPLTRADVEKFVRIRRAERTAMGETFPRLQQVYADVQAGEPVGWWTAVAAVQALGGSVADARTAMQRGLAAENLSRARYVFVRSKVNRALGLPEVDYSGILSDLGRVKEEGALPDLSGRVTPATAEERALVEYFSKELRVTAPLGLLGL